MTFAQLRALGDRLVGGTHVPAGYVLTCYLHEKYDHLVFHLRRPSPPALAGHTWVTDVMVDDHGEEPARRALGLLLEVAGAGQLPHCPADRTSPLIGGLSSRGWHLPAAPTRLD